MTHVVKVMSTVQLHGGGGFRNLGIHANVVLSLVMGRSRRCGCHVQVVGESEMARLNAVHSGKLKATDVLAFPTSYTSEIDFIIADCEDIDDGNSQAAAASGGVTDLGELFICPKNIDDRLRSRPYEHHDRDTYFLLAYVHGLLHLCGYRHETDSEHAIMREAERRCVRQLLHYHRTTGVLDRLRCPRVV